jgi:glutathione S-transferase
MSSKPQLISHALCPFVHRATAMLLEKNVPFDARAVDLQHKPDWFLKLSPRGKVPVLVAEGEAIFESLVILEYLDETTLPRLLPEAPLARAKQRMWCALADDLLLVHYKIAIAPTPAERAAAIEAGRGVLQRFESVVAGPLFDGEHIGLVDFAAGPGLVRIELLNAELGLDLYAGLPKLAAWSRAISTRPAFRDSLAPDFRDGFRDFIKRH